MKAAFFTGIRQLEIREVSEPELNRDDAVLLRTDRVGVCGSDVHYYVDGRIGNQLVEYPATLGHEFSGTIVEVGPQVKNLSPGDRVAVDPAIVCGHCDQCRAGRLNTCRNLLFMGCPGEAPGAVADYHVLPAMNCERVPDSMSLDEAALVEPLSIGLHAVRLAKPKPGDRIAVLGAGPIGLSVLLCIKATNEATVYMTDLFDNRLEVARRCGADWTANVGQPPSTGGKLPDVFLDGATAALTKEVPQGLDLVFECSGDPACIDQAQELLAPGGTLVLVGIPRDERVGVDVHRMRRMEFTFKNVRRQNECVGPVLRLIEKKLIDPSPMLTHRFALSGIVEAFDLVADYSDGVIKAVVDVSGEA